MAVLSNVVAAWQLLLAIPLPGDTRKANPGAWLWLPGLVVGMAVAAIGRTVVWLPATAVAGLMLLTELIITGGLHLDGWVDCWDGWGCRHDREKRLAAMKDSRIGSIGAAALVVLLLIKFSLYTVLAGSIVLVPAHMASRASLAACARLVPGRVEGLGAGFIRLIAPWHVLVNLLVVVGAFWFTSGFAGLFALSAGLIAAVVYAWYFARLAQGLGGDVLGGAQEASLVTTMMVLVLVAA
jgi:adenosylcobinamide-GDP ribazoletransferase